MYELILFLIIGFILLGVVYIFQFIPVIILVPVLVAGVILYGARKEIISEFNK